MVGTYLFIDVTKVVGLVTRWAYRKTAVYTVTA